jgi:3-oxoacyl-[acyl-carrier protein] reductase
MDNTLIAVRGNRVNEPKIKATKDLLDLSGQTVLVTGASGNIGGAIAERLHEAGAAVILHYHRNEAAAARLADRLSGAEIVQADLSDASAVKRLFTSITPSLVVNNAAAQPVTGLGDMTYAQWRDVMSANLDSAFLVTQRAALAWIAAGVSGAVVNIGSIEGSDPAVGHGHYATSKAGLLMLTRAAALEFGSDGIRVNCVSPGLIDREGLARDWPDGAARWQDRVPLGRMGSAIEVADAVLFLLSPAARWISGANLIVDGGMSAQSKW